MAEISKITLPNGAVYNIKDEVARAAAAAGLTLEVADNLPTAGAETMGKIYLILNHSSETQNIYDEYVTVIKGYDYVWEKLGTNEVDLSGYAKWEHTHNVRTNVSVDSHNYTPTGSIDNIDVTIGVTDKDGFDSELYSMDADGSYTPSEYTPESYEVSNEVLIINASQYTPESVTIPTRKKINITGSANTPAFHGDAATLTHTVNNPLVESTATNPE